MEDNIMAKKKQEKALNIDDILFKCRDILRKAANSGSNSDKRDFILTLVFYVLSVKSMRMALSICVSSCESRALILMTRISA